MFSLVPESQNAELIEGETRMVVPGAGGGGEGEMMVRGYRLPARTGVKSWESNV